MPADSHLVVRVEELNSFVESVLNDKKPEKLDKRAENTYLNIIGSLVELMLATTPSGNSYSSFNSQASIISALLANYENRYGIKQRTLEEKFAAAKRSTNAE